MDQVHRGSPRTRCQRNVPTRITVRAENFSTYIVFLNMPCSKVSWFQMSRVQDKEHLSEAQVSDCLPSIAEHYDVCNLGTMLLIIIT